MLTIYSLLYTSFCINAIYKKSHYHVFYALFSIGIKTIDYIDYFLVFYIYSWYAFSNHTYYFIIYCPQFFCYFIYRYKRVTLISNKTTSSPTFTSPAPVTYHTLIHTNSSDNRNSYPIY